MKTVISVEIHKCSQISEKGNLSGRDCPPNFDGSICWSGTQALVGASVECPFEFCSSCDISLPDRSVSRYCGENGTWAAPNYDRCLDIWANRKDCISAPCSPCWDDFKSVVQIITLVLSFASVVCLLISLCLFSIFESIQCPRLQIHKHLCSALIARFTSMIIWIFLHRYHAFSSCNNTDAIAYVCKVLLFIILYCTSASVYWMLVEGLYLASRISLFAMKGETPLFVFTWLGWGTPLVLTVIWSMLMAHMNKDKYCWLPYSDSQVRWILIIPILFALMVSLLLLVFIMVILIRKMTAHHAREPKTLWKATKAALLLAPLLGVTNLLFFVEPGHHDSVAHSIYIITNAIVQHSQGIFLAILYCFLNEEIQNAIRTSMGRSRSCSLTSPRLPRRVSVLEDPMVLLSLHPNRRSSVSQSI